MGVGGLLKEIPSRPEPRSGGASAPRRPVIAALMLAAGASSRMGGRDKLLEDVGGQPLIRHVAERVAASRADQLGCVIRPTDAARRAALKGLDVQWIENPIAEQGMGTSLAAGIRALGTEVDAALILLSDMPEVSAGDIDRMIAAFDPGEGRAIVRAVSGEGRPGNPVMFGRRFFEALAALDGDQGAKAVIAEHPEFVVDIALEGSASATDLDTPEDWRRWRAGGV